MVETGAHAGPLSPRGFVKKHVIHNLAPGAADGPVNSSAARMRVTSGNFYSLSDNLHSLSGTFHSLSGTFDSRSGKFYSLLWNFNSRSGNFPTPSGTCRSLPRAVPCRP